MVIHDRSVVCVVCVVLTWRERDMTLTRCCHFVICVSFCFPCDSGNICRSVNLTKNAGKFILIMATWLMHCCDLLFFNSSFLFDQWAACHLLIAHRGPGFSAHVSYPDAPLVSECVYLCVCVWVWVVLLSWWRLIFLDLERSSKCPLPAFISVCLLCTLTHTSLSVNHLLSQPVSDWPSNFFIFILMITRACLEARLSTFCHLSHKFVSVELVPSFIVDSVG